MKGIIEINQLMAWNVDCSDLSNISSFGEKIEDNGGHV